MKTVAIVDYGMGNVDSVARAVEECRCTATITGDPKALAAVDAIILPGVGAFGDGMEHLRSRGLEPLLGELVLERRLPFIGLCLGMQMLATCGDEGGDSAGLGWIPGAVRRLTPRDESDRVPHIGWNQVEIERDSPLVAGLPNGTDFYFAHSFFFDVTQDDVIVGRTEYCGGFPSVVARDNIFGVQFHPEKSQRAGLQLLRNFLAL